LLWDIERNYGEQRVGRHHHQRSNSQVILHCPLLLPHSDQSHIKQAGQEDAYRGGADPTHQIEHSLNVLDCNTNPNYRQIESNTINYEVFFIPPIANRGLLSQWFAFSGQKLNDRDRIVPASEK